VSGQTDVVDISPESLSRKTYQPPRKRETIKATIRQLEWALGGRSMFDGQKIDDFSSSVSGFSPPNSAEIRQTLEGNKRTYEEITPPENVPPLVKNRLYGRLKELDELIKYDMPTHDMMWKDIPGNVEHHMAWEEKNKKYILERRNILYLLDPQNDGDHFTTVEMLRSNTPPKGDPRKFFSNYDYIKWEEEAEAAVRTLDDDIYYRFLELKCAGWAGATICKELNWDKDVYEQAMSRWRKSITDNAYSRFLELKAAQWPASKIREHLGWSQAFYDEAEERWRESLDLDDDIEKPAGKLQPATAERYEEAVGGDVD